MRKELDEALVRDFPDLYQDRDGDPTKTLMCFGFGCGDGWEPIIRKLSEHLTFLAKAENTPITAFQVKEKFGTLRFYTNGMTDIMSACIAVAENRSAQTCETCGQYGRTRGGGWVRTLCAAHAHEKGKQITEHEAKKLGVTEYKLLDEKSQENDESFDGW